MGYRGTIEQLASGAAPGRIRAEYDETFPYEARQVRAGETLREGAPVDFIVLRGEVRDLFVVPPPDQRGETAPAAPMPKTYYRAIPADPVLTCYRRAMTKRWADFRGRARRKDYYSLLLCATIVLVLANIIDEALARTINPGLALFGWLPQDLDQDGTPEPVVLYAVTLLAGICHGIAIVSATVRRLHDAGHSASAMWIAVLPYVGVFFLLAQTLQDSEADDNAYGPSPKYRR